MTVTWSRAPGHQAGLTGQHGAAAPEGEAVLPLGEDGVTLLLPTLALLNQQGGVVHEPAVPRQAFLPVWRQLDLPVHLLILSSLLGNAGTIAKNYPYRG